MRDRRPSRHTGFHNLMEALQKRGCPLCRLASESSQRWLQALFHEQVNDVPTRQNLRRGGGFCSRHAAQALEIGDPLGSSIVYSDLLHHAIENFPLRWALTCPLCRHEAATVRATLHLLLDHIEEEDVHTAYEASDGLCLPHLRQAVAHFGGPRVDSLAAIERSMMAALARECEGFVAKSDYRDHAGLTKAEATAWRRAARKIAGGYSDDDA